MAAHDDMSSAMDRGLNRKAIAFAALLVAGCQEKPVATAEHCPRLGGVGLHGSPALKTAQICMDAAAVRMSTVSDPAETVAKAAAVECREKIDRVLSGEKDPIKAEGVMALLEPKMVERSAGLVVAARAGKCMENAGYRKFAEDLGSTTPSDDAKIIRELTNHP